MQPKFKTYVEKRDGQRFLKVKDLQSSLDNKKHSFDIRLPDKTRPLVCYTATTGMIESIGNMINNNSATGYAFGNSQYIFKNVNNPFNLSKGERVYISEHLQLNGKPEYIVSKHRIAQGANNFLNVGYIQNNQQVIKLVIDIITGEYKWLK